LVTDVDWWEHQAFRDGVALEAAETVAFEVLNPTLRSRSAVQRLARQYREEETDFESEMRELFAGPPTGRLTRPSLETAFVKIDALEKRIAELEHRLADLSFKTRRD
jgi:hypothetical protein